MTAALVALATLAALGASGRDAAAQTRLSPTAEAAIGYAFLHDQESSTDLPVGWMASLAGTVTDWLAIAGEVGGHYTTQSQDGIEARIRLHTFTTGPRLMATARTRLAPFGQILIGVAYGSVGLAAGGLDVVTRGTSFVYQPGAGVDVNLSTRRALRFEVDVRGLRDQGRTLNQWRVAAAVVFRN